MLEEHERKVGALRQAIIGGEDSVRRNLSRPCRRDTLINQVDSLLRRMAQRVAAS